MSSSSTCKECGAAIPADSPGGFCAQCLLGLGLEENQPPSDANDAPQDTEFGVPPSGNPEPAPAGPPNAVVAPAEKPGDRIGRYRLLQEIGHGGCGVVYMAEQEEPVRRKVALKVIKLGMDTRQVVARFEAERQALALMDHPNIAKILDAGVTEGRARHSVRAGVETSESGAQGTDAPYLSAGRPYFVMELVGGIRITDYCDQNNLTTRQRLDLFIQVCRAIQHAHQKGIIHRDIKPSNILVATQDGVPVPKVIDFGIAKATQGRLTDQTLFTAFEQFIGTPAYMSPEQAQLGGMDVDTRSDIYSLGVLLYELLTGRTPFDTKELVAAGLDEMRRTIREVDPVKPSTRLTSELVAADKVGRVAPCAPPGVPPPGGSDRVNAGLQTADGAHGVTRPTSGLSALSPQQLKELIHQLRGDLDWIVMKCLEKDRARRYETANGLARDIERHLNNEPVVARPPSKLYEFQKTVRRHKFGFAATAALMLVLAVSCGGILWQWRKATRHAELEQRERRRAEQATQHAQAALNQMQAIELRRAEEYYEAGDRRNMLPYLALVLRQNPSNRLAAERLFSTLSHRPWARLACPPLVHSNRVTSGAFSRDGRWVVTSASDNTASVWDASTGQRIAGPMTHQAEINTAEFSPDGQFVLTASDDRTARVWDARTGRPVTDPIPHPARLELARFSPDSRAFVTLCDDRAARLWDTRSGRSILKPLRHGDGPSQGRFFREADFSPDGARLATAAKNAGQVRIWSTRTGETVETLQHGWLETTGVRFSPDGRRLAAGFYTNSAVIWDLMASPARAVWFAPPTNVVNIEFSPDGARVVTASTGGAAQVWDAVSGQPIGPPLHHANQVRCAAFSLEGQRVVTASSDQTVRVWDAQTGEALTEPMNHDSGAFFAQFSPDGERVLTACNGSAVLIWHVLGTTALDFHVGAPVNQMAFSPGGSRLAVASRGDHTRVWETLTGQPHTPPFADPPQNWINQVVFSPDGSLVATACDDGGSRISRADDGRLVARTEWERVAKQYPGTEAWPNARWVAFRRDGKQLLLTINLASGTNHFATIWDVQTGELLLSIRHDARLNQPACFSPDGTEVLTAAETGIARVWNARSGHPVTPPLPHPRNISSAQFSPDGRFVLTTAGAPGFFVWDKQTGRQLESPWLHRNMVTSACYSRDGKRVLTSGSGAGPQIWDLQTGISLAGEFGSPDVVRADFGFDDSRVLLSYPDGGIQMWDAVSGQRLSEVLWQGGGVTVSRCNVEGSLIAVCSTSGTVSIREIPAADLPVPEWLPELAEALAGQRFSERGLLVPVSPAGLWGVQEKLMAWVRSRNPNRQSRETPAETTTHPPSSFTPRHHAIADSPKSDAAYVCWANWFIAHPDTRTVLPSSPLTIAQYAQSLVKQGGSPVSARKALLLQPTDAVAMSAVAATMTNVLEADWLSRRAMELVSKGSPAPRTREELLHQSGNTDGDLAHLEKHPSQWAANAWIWKNRGEVCEKLGRSSEALEAYAQALSLALVPVQVSSRQDQELLAALLDDLLLCRSRLLRRFNRPTEAQADFLRARHIPTPVPRVPGSRFSPIDLRPHLNRGLQDFGLKWALGATNSIAPLRTLAGVEFELCGSILLNDQDSDPTFPPRMLNMRVGQRCRALHFLQSCDACPGCTNDWLVASYVVHFAGGTDEKIPIVGAQDVRYWFDPHRELGPGTEEAWSGRNDKGESFRLFKRTWTNPHPELQIESIDFLSAGPYSPHPILFAITAEP